MEKDISARLEIRESLFNLVAIILSGLREEDGLIKEGIGESQISETKAYKVIHQLSKEFPEFLPHYFPSMFGEVPYFKDLDDVLFSLRAFNVIQRGDAGKESIFTISEKNKLTILDIMRREYRNEELKMFIPIVARFYELMNTEPWEIKPLTDEEKISLQNYADEERKNPLWYKQDE
jgi:hypothetical protein